MRPAQNLALLLMLSCEACAPDAQDVGESLSQKQLGLGALRHEQTTRAGVSAWVTPETADEFVAVSTIGDSDPVANSHSETHFDNCYWDEGRDWVLLKRGDAIKAALQYEQSGEQADRSAFFDSFGYVLHAAEDFYAHSNWIETHDPGVIANFSDPGVTRPAGWVSGTYDNPGDTGPNAGAGHCPVGTLPHSLLNKDGPGGLGGDEAFLDATLAVTLELRKLIAAIRTESPSRADSALGKLGFLVPEPSPTPSRADDVRTVELAGAGKGLFTPALFCRPDTFASGFEQRVEENQGSGDDTTLNSVALLCSDRDGNLVERLSAWEGVWGTWSDASSCAKGQFLTRGQLKIEALQATGDDTSANAARWRCGDGAQLVASNDGAWGTWKGEAACESGEAVCGVEIAYQAPQDTGDDVAMTGMRVHCCSIDGAAGGDGGIDSGNEAAIDGETETGSEPGFEAGDENGSKPALEAGSEAGNASTSTPPDQGGCACGTRGGGRPGWVALSGVIALGLLRRGRRELREP